MNCILPGHILTDLNRAIWVQPHMKNWLEGCQPNSRLGTPSDVAPLAVFLSSPGSDYISGQLIAVEDGFSNCRVWPVTP